MIVCYYSFLKRGEYKCVCIYMSVYIRICVGIFIYYIENACIRIDDIWKDVEEIENSCCFWELWERRG